MLSLFVVSLGPFLESNVIILIQNAENIEARQQMSKQITFHQTSQRRNLILNCFLLHRWPWPRYFQHFLFWISRTHRADLMKLWLQDGPTSSPFWSLRLELMIILCPFSKVTTSATQFGAQEWLIYLKDYKEHQTTGYSSKDSDNCSSQKQGESYSSFINGRRF